MVCVVIGSLLLPSVASAQPKAELETVLCGKRAECFVRSAQDGGKNEHGTPMYVVDIGLAGTKADYDSPVFSDPDECKRHEIWLIAGKSKKRLLELCNDGYGAKGIGEDTFEVGKNRLTHTQLGGSSWGWSTTTTWQLSPFKVIKESSSGWHIDPEANNQDTEWNWLTFSGHTSWYSAPCDTKKKATGPYLHALVPRVAHGKRYREGGWKTNSPGSCSAVVTSAQDASKSGRGVIHGKPGSPRDATMRVVAISGREFIIEVEDDKFVASAKNWLHADHLEIWAGPHVGYMDHCIEGTKKPTQWGVMLDGTVHAAYGKPKSAPLVSVHREKNVARFRVQLPADAPRVTVVYSDSDGERAERLIATSNLKFGKLPTLGAVKQVERCPIP